jgi:polysaccharide biosynthesis transport protein
LARLQQQLDDLRRRVTDAYPDVVRLRVEIESLTAEIAQHPSKAATTANDTSAQTGEALAGVNAELGALKQEEQTLRQTIASYEQRVENAPKRQQEFQEMSRDYENTKERYESLLKRYEEAQLAENLEQGQKVEQFRMLDSALAPREPVAPNRIRLLLLGFAMAAGLATGAVIGAEKLDTAFHDIDELRTFVGIPTLGPIPLIATRASRRRRFQRGLLTVTSAVALLVLILAGVRYVARGNEQIVRMMERSRG